MRRRRFWVLAAGGVAVVAACSAGDPAGPASNRKGTLDDYDLVSPRFCADCHPQQYVTWSASMHAYAGIDPVFRALNQRMQRETKGTMATLCVQCHAPMALRLGWTQDGTNLDSVPSELQGVTCIFCHTVSGTHGTENNPLDLDPDRRRLRGGILDPLSTRAHESQFSELLDGTNDGSPGLCGPCHDIVTPAGARIERTFDEWRRSRFGVGEQFKQSCAFCHMPETTGRAAEVPGAGPRAVHDHTMPGVDVALTFVPRKAEQRAGVQAFLDDAIDVRLCVTRDAAGADVEATMVNTRVGHGWPSGSNQDRRAWIDLDARDSAGVTLFTSGKIPDDRAVAAAADANLFLLRDHVFDAEGHETELFWRAASFTSAQLPAAQPLRPEGQPVRKTYRIDGAVAEVSMRIKIRPIDHDLLAEVVATGDLDPTSIDPITTFTLKRSELVWRVGGPSCVP